MMIMGLLLAVVITMVLSYKKFFSHHKESTTGNYKEVLAVLIGAVATYYLSQAPHMNAILASSIVGLSISFAPQISPKIKDIEDFPPAVYCGSFVGMSSELVLDNIWLLVNAALVSGLIFSYSKTTMHGFGGKLGTVAFGGVLILITFYIIYIFITWIY